MCGWCSSTFTHVPFGTHHLSATLNDYEPIKQDIEVRRGMTPEIHLKLKQDPVSALLAEAKKYDEGTPQQLTAYGALRTRRTSTFFPPFYGGPKTRR